MRNSNSGLDKVSAINKSALLKEHSKTQTAKIKAMRLTKQANTNELKTIMFYNNFRFTSVTQEVLRFAHEDNELKTISIKLVISEEVDASRHGSVNDNPVDGIGIFRFDLQSEECEPDYFAFALRNLNTNAAEFVIVTNEGLKKRVIENKLRKENSVYMRLWLMDDRKVYETTYMGMEGEWYFLSKGINGRMADKTASDYSRNLNAWNQMY